MNRLKDLREFYDRHYKKGDWTSMMLINNIIHILENQEERLNTQLKFRKEVEESNHCYKHNIRKVLHIGSERENYYWCRQCSGKNPNPYNDLT